MKKLVFILMLFISVVCMGQGEWQNRQDFHGGLMVGDSIPGSSIIKQDSVTGSGGNIYLYSWGDSYLLGPGTVWSAITNTPTTLSGYGIVGTKANFNTALSDGTFLFVGDPPTAHNQAWSTITSTPTTLSGYSISDAKINFNTALSDGSFMFIGDAPTAHNQAWSTITSTPTTLSGYSINDTKTNFNTALSDGTFLFVGDPPTAHASSHLSSGGDAISNFSTSSTTSGLVPGSNSVGSTYYINANGTWSVPAGGGGATIFTDLTDVPANYTGDGYKDVKVNAAENALEFVYDNSNRWYFSNDGNDANHGHSEEYPKQTITELESLILEPGDIVLFNRGDTWGPDQLRINESGTYGNPITFTAYGIGAKPILTMRDTLPGWSGSGNWTQVGNYWWMTVTKNPYRIWVDGQERKEAEEFPSQLNSQYSFLYRNSATDTLYYYSATNPASTFSLMEVANGISGYPFHSNGEDYINLSYLNIQGGQYSLFLYGGHGWIIDSCEIGAYAVNGLYTRLGSASDQPDSGIVRNCLFDPLDTLWYTTAEHSNVSNGIIMRQGTDNWLIYNNTFKNWGHDCISVTGTDDTTVSLTNIKIYDNFITSPDVTYSRGFGFEGAMTQVSGCEFYRNYIYNTPIRNQLTSSNWKIYNNIIDSVRGNTYHPGDDIGAGLGVYNYIGSKVIGNEIVNNIIIRCAGAGLVMKPSIAVDDDMMNNIIKNNIIAFNDTADGIQIILEDTDDNGVLHNNVYNNNLFFNTAASASTDLIWYWEGGGDYKFTVTEFNALHLTVGDSIQNNLETNPRFTDLLKDYDVYSTSPVVGTGINVSWYTEDYNQTTVSDPPNIGALESVFKTINGYAEDSHIFNVLNYGAIGDGVTDDATAINATITVAEGGIVYFPAGTYRVESVLTAAINSVRLIGDGIGITTIKGEPEPNHNIFTVGGDYWSFEHMTIDGNCSEKNDGGNYHGIYLDAKTNFKANNVEFINHDDGCLQMTPGSHNIIVENCEFRDSWWNAIVANDGGTDNVVIKNCVFDEIDYVPIYVGNTNKSVNWKIEGCSFTHCGYRIKFVNAESILVNNCYFQNVGEGVPSATNSSVSFEDGWYNKISNCVIDFGQGGGLGIHSQIDFIASNITFSNNEGGNMTIGASEYSGDACEDVTVKDCRFLGSTNLHVLVATGLHERVRFVNCTFLDAQYGIRYQTDNKDYLVVRGCHFENMSSIALGRYGSVGVADNFRIENNTFVNCLIGLHLDEGDDNLILNNRFDGCTDAIIMEAEHVRSVIMGNNWYGCTNDPDFSGTTNPRITNNIDKAGAWWTVDDK